MNIYDLIEPNTEFYIGMREAMRRKARLYARERVGESQTNSRARAMLASAFDAGVSAAIERMREQAKLDADAFIGKHTQASPPTTGALVTEKHNIESREVQYMLTGRLFVDDSNPLRGTGRLTWVSENGKRGKLFYEDLDRSEPVFIEHLREVQS